MDGWTGDGGVGEAGQVDDGGCGASSPELRRWWRRSSNGPVPCAPPAARSEQAREGCATLTAERCRRGCCADAATAAIKAKVSLIAVHGGFGDSNGFQAA